jgi:hypothetical protein
MGPKIKSTPAFSGPTPEQRKAMGLPEPAAVEAAAAGSYGKPGWDEAVKRAREGFAALGATDVPEVDIAFMAGVMLRTGASFTDASTRMAQIVKHQDKR